MPSHPVPPPARRSVGEFLCRHPSAPPFEDIDQLPILDIKQDAALRAILALRQLGKPVTDDAVATFDAEPTLVLRAYRFAYLDALKTLRARGQHPRASAQFLLAAVPDPAQHAQLAALEDDHPTELRRLRHHGIPGLTRQQTRRVIHAMLAAQRAKDRGGVPHALRQRLHRLRQETGLPLTTTHLS